MANAAGACLQSRERVCARRMSDACCGACKSVCVRAHPGAHVHRARAIVKRATSTQRMCRACITQHSALSACAAPASPSPPPGPALPAQPTPPCILTLFCAACSAGLGPLEPQLACMPCSAPLSATDPVPRGGACGTWKPPTCGGGLGTWKPPTRGGGLGTWKPPTRGGGLGTWKPLGHLEAPPGHLEAPYTLPCWSPERMLMPCTPPSVPCTGHAAQRVRRGTHTALHPWPLCPACSARWSTGLSGRTMRTA